jgi:pimeloyl-ACP methyl ester carboxylesterase
MSDQRSVSAGTAPRLTSHLRALSLIAPLQQAEDNKGKLHVSAKAAERVDMRYLALAAIELLIDRMGAGGTASRTELIEYLADLARFQSPRLSDADAAALAEHVFDGLTNARDRRARFRVRLFDPDQPEGVFFDMPMIGQAFVQFQIPQPQTHPYPIVMVHGGGQTGSGWISTPDGRDGWATYFLRRGYAVYVVDQVARGRSPYIVDVYGPSRAQSREYTMQRFSTSEKYNSWPQAKLHTQWPGNAQPGDPVFDNYFASSVPSMDNREAQSNMNIEALTALLDRIGPSIVLVHSQSGQYGWPLAQARPALVKAIVAAEPSGPPVHDVVVPGEARFGMVFENATKVEGTAMFRDDPRLKRYGLTDTSLTYTPAVTPESPLRFVQQEKAEAPDLVKCWRQVEPARKLVAVGDGRFSISPPRHPFTRPIAIAL